MLVDTRNMISMTEANQNFSKVARMVDQNGSAVIVKNNKPRYLIVSFETAEEIRADSNQDLIDISKQLIQKNRKAYEELSK